MSTRSASLLAIVALGLAACGKPEGNEAQSANEAVQPANSAQVDAGAGAPEAAPSGNLSNAASSGMPVPGTNTPEHIVVNEDQNAR